METTVGIIVICFYIQEFKNFYYQNLSIEIYYILGCNCTELDMNLQVAQTFVFLQFSVANRKHRINQNDFLIHSNCWQVKAN